MEKIKAKTMSIIGVGKCSGSVFNSKKVLDICKAWVITFPVCGILGYGISVLILMCLQLV